MPSITDILFNFTEWLRTTPIVDFALWLVATPLSDWIQRNFYIIPLLQTVHILSVAALFGSSVLMNFRILGINGSSRTMVQTTKRYIPWIWWSFLVLAITGLGMTIGEPPRELVNPIYWIKIGLLLVAVVANLRFNAAVRKQAANWDGTTTGHGAIRAGAIGMLLLWCAIMTAGRWIAYAPV